MASGQCIHTLRGHNDEILDVCFDCEYLGDDAHVLPWPPCLLALPQVPPPRTTHTTTRTPAHSRS